MRTHILKYWPASRSVAPLLLGLTFALVTPIAVARPENVSDSELQLLPRYCRDTQWFQERYARQRDFWVSRMGPTFSHMHHYCWGLLNLNRARKADVQLGRNTAGIYNILNDFHYVTNLAPADFVLLPEIYTRIGEVELLAKNPRKANKAFSRARELKPDYWPAYSHWAEFLIKARKRTEAMEMVKSGLQHAPKSKVLREQYRLLGGNLRDIPPTLNGASPDEDLSPKRIDN